MSCYNCNRTCNKLCPNFIISDPISVVTVDGTDTLVIDIPVGTYGNGCTYCIITAQTIPATSTINQPVAISIGGDTTTVYPLICSRTGLQATACQVDTRMRIKVVVCTNATTGVFKALGGLGSCFTNNLRSLPVTTTTATTEVVTAVEPVAQALSANYAVATASDTTTTIKPLRSATKKEVATNE